ncbi:DNA-protecting protein DprA [filamentous cyanobacterium CCP5]|nr:DNA-protecting protein DprA [filamentous cyanobacterium CCP5]
MIEERAYWLAWSQLYRVGPILIKRLHSHFGSLGTAWEAPPPDLMMVDGIGIKLAEGIASQRRSLDPAQILAQQQGHFWTPADAEYPTLLFEICDPPPVLYYKGRTELIWRVGQNFSVGIVGTRSPTDYGRRWTRQIVRQLVQQDSLIVSGLARGIDQSAHEATLYHRGQTIAVLGTGVDVVYPTSNRYLYDQIAESGLLVSEYPDGTPPDRTHFPQRNRIIAGLSQAVVVTEAPERSGALITAHLANDYGRDVYALPGSLDNPQIKGCLSLINQGAQMILNPDTLVREVSPSRSALAQANPAQVIPAPADPAPDLSASLRPIYQAVSVDGIGLDRLVETLSLETGLVLSALVQLELMGLVVQLPGMRYQRGQGI